MSRQDVRFSPRDAALREDVSTLGELLGDLLLEQGGEELYRAVETARRTAISRREGEPAAARAAEADLSTHLASLAPRQATDLVHAFGAYFQVVNLAEKVHRIRRMRYHARPGKPPQPESLAEAIGQLADAGLSLDEVVELLGEMEITPVFTAHPTQATRQSILHKQQRIARRLVEGIDPAPTPRQEHIRLARIRADMTTVWQTESHPYEGRTVADEVDYVLFYLTGVIYRIIPVFQETLRENLVTHFGEAAREVALPPMVRFASWVGGDMDGNPNVNADTMRETLASHRRTLLTRYRTELNELYDHLSQSPSRVNVDPAILERINDYHRRFPEELEHIPARHRNMPYRVLLRMLSARLAATAAGTADAYAEPEQFRDDLQLIADSLRNNKGEHAGLFWVQRLLIRVQTFGFHLASLDIRQHAEVHREVAGKLLGMTDWDQREPSARAATLREALAHPGEPAAASDDETVRATLDVFRAIIEGRERHGRDSFGPWIVSMTRQADDVLAVLYLAQQAGLVDADGHIPLDVVPLLETPEDLEQGPPILADLLKDDGYRRHLLQRGNRQMVMVGYSDSNKSGGLAASRWAVHTTQQQLAAMAREAGVGLTIFHGRGGTASRGAGKVHNAVRAAPADAVRGRFRVTEQGEIIDANYGLRAIASRTLEQMTSGVMLASTDAIARPAEREEWTRMMQHIADAARDAYRGMVYQDPRFHGYFRQATPIDVIERMRIGSRPPSRQANARIEDLRAIPWVFSWTQSRHLLSGWYGLGSGLVAATEAFGHHRMRRMARHWPFLVNLLDDTEMVLAKADLNIARRYAELADGPSRALFKIIQEEFERTVDCILHLKGIDALLDRDPSLQRSIRLRNPYIDPLSLLQIDLLARWRETDREDDELFQALLETVNGIAQGLQNTG